MDEIVEDRLSEKVRGQVVGPKPAVNGLFQVPAGEQFVAATREQGLTAWPAQKGSEGGTQKVHTKRVAGNQLAALRPLKETVLGLPPIFPEIASQETIHEEQHRIVPVLDMR